MSFKMRRGETLGLVGESGCGKTTLGAVSVPAVQADGGAHQVQGEREDLLDAEKEFRPLRSDIAIIFQDPYGSLDPRQTAGSIVGEPLKIHKMARARPSTTRGSGPLRQGGPGPQPHAALSPRVQRGAAAAHRDRPGSGRRPQPDHLRRAGLGARRVHPGPDHQPAHGSAGRLSGLTYIFIAHDLSVVKHISDRIAVMYLGRIVEMGGVDALYARPAHPYTVALLSAALAPRAAGRPRRIILSGEIPSPDRPPAGAASILAAGCGAASATPRSASGSSRSCGSRAAAKRSLATSRRKRSRTIPRVVRPPPRPTREPGNQRQPREPVSDCGAPSGASGTREHCRPPSVASSVPEAPNDRPKCNPLLDLVPRFLCCRACHPPGVRHPHPERGAALRRGTRSRGAGGGTEHGIEPRLQAGTWKNRVPFFGTYQRRAVLQPVGNQRSVLRDRRRGGHSRADDGRRATHSPIPAAQPARHPRGRLQRAGRTERLHPIRGSDGHMVWAHLDQWEGQHWNTSPGNLVSPVPRSTWIPRGLRRGLELTMRLPPVNVPPDTERVRRLRFESNLLSDSGATRSTSARSCCCPRDSMRTPRGTPSSITTDTSALAHLRFLAAAGGRGRGARYIGRSAARERPRVLQVVDRRTTFRGRSS